MRLALYAHYSTSPDVARHVIYHVGRLSELGFRVCLISNSPLSGASERKLATCCHRVIQRENTGFDFCMWQRGLSEYDMMQVDELLLTNSSIIGPLNPLEPLWDHPAAAECDFWGLTDNRELGHHLQSYFLVFRRQVFRSAHFGEFWRSVLPFGDKDQVVRSYEVGLTRWLEEKGFRWKALFTQEHIWAMYLQERSLVKKVRDRWHKRGLPGCNTSLWYADLLLRCGMPYMKASLLREGGGRVTADKAFEFLEASGLPRDLIRELRPAQGM